MTTTAQTHDESVALLALRRWRRGIITLGELKAAIDELGVTQDRLIELEAGE
jgi:hypothetical protein